MSVSVSEGECRVGTPLLLLTSWPTVGVSAAEMAAMVFRDGGWGAMMTGAWETDTAVTAAAPCKHTNKDRRY